LGNPEEITLLELARRVLVVTGSASGIVHRELPEDDPKVRRPDIGKARELLGWEPKVALDEGLRRVLPYFRSKVA
ncbi:MAG TPA: SDR family NAD-dependent epimerase/dehydratase, partial [Syntrophales bacterium]|nr:SDR family NAD-dependent epimerase/dehydratase [Syntrophales bacterium]